MEKGIRINRYAEAIVLLAVIATIGFILACIDAPPRQYSPPTGMSGLTGWNGSGIWFDSENHIYRGSIDINGEVGHPLYVGSCRATCEPGGQWTANHRILSGSLPPGMDFNTNNSGIEGIPTERGHWIVQLELYDITCNGSTYAGIKQELRFHISGTGRVIQ